MSKKSINLNAEAVDVASLVKSRNRYKIGSWSLLYNENKNPAKFKFEDIKPRAIRISISESTGWVRLLRPIDVQAKPGIYSISLILRSLTADSSSKYTPYVFVSRKAGCFEKHSKLSKCDAGYKTNLHISDDSPSFWIGFETVEPTIELLLDHIRLEVVEHSVELVKSLADCKTSDLPLASNESKSPQYQAIHNWNKDYLSLIAADELPFLLNYAIGLRKVEMPETFLKIIRYLVVKYSSLDKAHHAMFAVQVRNALTISHDETLIKLIMNHCPQLLPALDLSEEVYCRLSGLNFTESEINVQELDKHAFFMLQNNPISLLRLVRKELAGNPSYLVDNPAANCAFANAYAGKVGCHENYMAYLNSYLGHHGLSKLVSVGDNDQQGLAGFQFSKNSTTVDNGPLVSVMMSAYEAEDTVGYAIESLLNQTYQNIEILVCDDGSTDGTVEIALQWALKDNRVKVFQSNSNQGTYNIRNSLIKEAKGEFLTFHDSDDLALPCRLQEQLSVLSEEKKMVCFSQWVRMSDEGKIVYFHDGHVSRFCVVSAMAHRSVFERLPPFRSALVAADTEFYELCKYLLSEEEIAIVKKPLIFGLWGQGSLTKREHLAADHSGYVAPRRRAYAEIAARQRLLGDMVVTDKEVDKKLKELDIYRQAVGIKPVTPEYDTGINTDPLTLQVPQCQSEKKLKAEERIRLDTHRDTGAKTANNIAA